MNLCVHSATHTFVTQNESSHTWKIIESLHADDTSCLQSCHYHLILLGICNIIKISTFIQFTLIEHTQKCIVPPIAINKQDHTLVSQVFFCQFSCHRVLSSSTERTSDNNRYCMVCWNNENLPQFVPPLLQCVYE